MISWWHAHTILVYLFISFAHNWIPIDLLFKKEGHTPYRCNWKKKVDQMREDHPEDIVWETRRRHRLLVKKTPQTPAFASEWIFLTRVPYIPLARDLFIAVSKFYFLKKRKRKKKIECQIIVVIIGHVHSVTRMGWHASPWSATWPCLVYP